MNNPRTYVLTGASGGIGRAIASRLDDAGYRLVLVGRNQRSLQNLRVVLGHQSRHHVFCADLCTAAGRADLLAFCQSLPEGICGLINNAGISEFSNFEDTRDSDLEQMMCTNLMVPMMLVRDLLPILKQSVNPCIINMGSTFGSIGYAGFAAYSASKFGLRGFTEALRRELSDTGIAVHYLAPRAVNTDMNTVAVKSLNEQLGNATDTPDVVAEACLQLIESPHSRSWYLGWPEKLFVRLNALFPSLVDGALRKQLPTIRRFARSDVAGEML